jgi:anti-anti-sigma regulatory factor
MAAGWPEGVTAVSRDGLDQRRQEEQIPDSYPTAGWSAVRGAGEASFEVQCASFPQAVVLSVRGEVDSFSSDLFRAVLVSALGQTTGCVIVAPGSTFFDTAATFTLLQVARAAEPAGKSVLLAGPARLLYRVLDMFPAAARPARYPSVTEALAAAAGRLAADRAIGSPAAARGDSSEGTPPS